MTRMRIDVQLHQRTVLKCVIKVCVPQLNYLSLNQEINIATEFIRRPLAHCG